jgi:hypothetical protein
MEPRKKQEGGDICFGTSEGFLSFIFSCIRCNVSIYQEFIDCHLLLSCHILFVWVYLAFGLEMFALVSNGLEKEESIICVFTALYVTFLHLFRSQLDPHFLYDLT